MSDIIKIREDFLNLSEGLYVTENIQRIKWEDYLPQESSENFNRDSADINIRVDNVDNFLLLQNSYFIFDIELHNAANQLFTAGDIALTHNGLMYLFGRVELRFNDVPLEAFRCVGPVTTVQGVLQYDNGYSESSGLQQCWSLDRHDFSASESNSGFSDRKRMLFAAHDKKGKCRFIVPFSHIFGFKGKILSGIKISVQFQRRDNADSVYKTAVQASNADTVGDGHVVIKALKWKIPYIYLNNEARLEIDEYLTTKPRIWYKFYTKQVEEFIVSQNRILDRQVINVSDSQKIVGIAVCFQTGRNNSQKANASLFDDVDFYDGDISINNVTYPGFTLDCNSKNGNYMINYERFVKFRKLFTNGHPEITPIDFRQAYPIYCFDTSHQEQRINGSSVAVKLHMRFNSNIPANTTCYIIIFKETKFSVTTTGDRKMEFQDINTF